MDDILIHKLICVTGIANERIIVNDGAIWIAGSEDRIV